MRPVAIGDPQYHQGLTLFPLVPAIREPTRSWTLLVDALEAGTIEVTEVGDGVVGELHVANRGPEPVLILDGEQLIGAKQNRTTNRTILVAAASETPIPVSCMEQGRWRHRSPSMKHGRDFSPSHLRRCARRVEADAVARRAAEGPDTADEPERPEGPDRDAAPSELLSMAQGDVWRGIAESSRRAGVRSSTGALDEICAGRRERLAELERRFPALADQVGFLAFVGDHPVGLDILPLDAYPRVHDRLVRAYGFEALDAEVERAMSAPGSALRQGAPREVASTEADAFLSAVWDAARRPMATPGLGTYAALTGDVVGGELAVGGSTVHLSAFPAA